MQLLGCKGRIFVVMTALNLKKQQQKYDEYPNNRHIFRFYYREIEMAEVQLEI